MKNRSLLRKVYYIVYICRNLWECIRDLEALRREVVVLREDVERLTEQSHTDELTGLLNARGFFFAAGKEVERATRLRYIVSLVYIDLDVFKAVNDQYGHAYGDSYLRAFADCLRAGVRSYDVVARAGGDEFIILFSAATEKIAEQRVQLLRTSAVFNAERISFSYGICSSSETTALEELIYRADRRMYDDKGLKKRINTPVATRS